jgi:hypothetical protein
MTHPLKLWVFRKCVQPLVLGAARFAAAGVNRYNLDDDAHRVFDEGGFHLLRKHFYLPIPEPEDLGDAFWERRSEMVGVDMNDAGALALLADAFPGPTAEFRELFPLRAPGGDSSGGGDDPTRFHLLNGSFMAVDAHVYYALIRHFRPRRIVEVGAGNSTLVAAAACLRNQKEDGHAPTLTAIDPFPQPSLKRGFPGLSRLVESRVQDVPMDVFTSLEAGDILFIDSTHVLREGGDVQLEYCEILPRLAPGVVVHIHDISLPRAYPRVYTERLRLYWNEQYLLQTFLAYNSRFEVLWPGNYMMLKYPERVVETFPEFRSMREDFPESEPSSFWMRVRP